MSSFVDGRHSERRRPSPALWADAPIGLQMAASLAIGFVIAAAAWFVIPDAVSMVTQFFGTGVHELGHLLGAILQDGEIHDIVIARQGGHAEVAATDGVATAIAGPLMVPLLAMFTLVAALCRWGLQVWLAAFGSMSIVLGLMADDLVVRWALLPWGAVLCLIAVLPLYEALRAAFLVVVGLVLIKATVDSLPYLSTQEVVLQDGQTVLSDTGRIADLLGQELLDVRDMLVFAMLVMALSGICLVGRFLFIHRRSQ
jgi:hypothetical protein